LLTHGTQCNGVHHLITDTLLSPHIILSYCSHQTVHGQFPSLLFRCNYCMVTRTAVISPTGLVG